MSTTVDSRVVEMRFDNQQFETNVATSMSTLDKLKKSLNLTGAAKGLENINSASKKFDLSGMSNAVDTIKVKFSALQVAGVTALANITNSAVNAGKRMVSALTIDPIKTGFQEYETQINAVQTILANTQSKGTTIDQVNDALAELNKYADLTIYNFTEMTRNIGTFTSAGIDLETSVSAIQGIANLAAVSGSTSQQASTAMYQLSQALASGTVKLMDWNSVVNAGMGGQVFQDALKTTSELLGTGAEAAIKANGSFRESLSEGWLTAEVLTETLKKFTTSGANEYVAEYTGLSKEAVQSALEEAEARYGEADAIEKASEALADKSGKNKDEIQQALEFAKTAEDAATKVKTFTQLWDVMKEAAQSGWSQTWQIIIGDFEEAKSLFTPLADFFTNIIGKMSDARNNVLEGALGKPLGKLIDQVSGFSKKATETVNTVENLGNSVKDLGKVVDRVLNGDLGSGEKRFEKLTEEGYNWMEVQNKVNEAMGNSHRYTQEEIDAQNELLGTEKKVIEGKEYTLDQLAAMSDAKLKDIGFTQDEVSALRELEKQAKKSGMSLSEFVENYDEMDGRTLLIESFKNAGKGLVEVCKAISSAWREVFWGDASDEDILQTKVNALHSVIVAMHDFSENLVMSAETADNVKRTFRGLLSIFSLGFKGVSGGVKIAFEVLNQVLGAFDLTILDVTAKIGDMAYKVDMWVKKNNLIKKGIDLAIPAIVKMGTAIGDWAKSMYELPVVQKAIEQFCRAFNAIDEVFSDLQKRIGSLTFDDFINALTRVKEAVKSAFSNLFSGVGEDSIAGLVNGLKAGVAKVAAVVATIGETILETIKSVLGIHSPSTEMRAVGENAIQGLYNGFKEGTSRITGILKKLADKIIEVFDAINWKKVFSLGMGAGILVLSKQMLDIIGSIASPFAGLGELMAGAGKVMDKSAKAISKTIASFSKVLKGFSHVLNSLAFEHSAAGVKDLAISLAIMAGAIVALSFIDIGKLWNAVGVIAALAVILGILAVATEKMSKASLLINKDGVNAKSLSAGLLGISAALFLLAYTVKIIGDLNPDQAKQGFIGLAGLILAVAAVFAAYGFIVKGKAAQNIDKAGFMLTKMALSLLILVKVVWLVGMLTPDAMYKGAAFAAAFIVFVALLVKATESAGKKIDQVGNLILKVSAAMLLLAIVVKMVGALSWEEMQKGAIFAEAFLIFIGLLVKITTVGKDGQIAKLGGLLLSISVSLILLVGVIKLVSKLSVGEMIKGGLFVAAFLLFVKQLVKITTISNEQQTAKIATTILAMSLAIGILAGVCILLGLVDLGSLAKGVVAVSFLGGIMTAMIWACRGVQDIKGNLIVLTIAIGLMAAAVVALSFIDTGKLAGATAALVFLMGAFALIVKASASATSAIGGLIAMTVAVGLLAGILYLISLLPIDKTIVASASLSILLISIAVAFKIISKAAVDVLAALPALTVMVVAVGLLAIILGALTALNVAPSIQTAVALSVLLLAMSAACIILSTVGAVAPAALIGAAALVGVIAIIGAAAIAIGGLMSLIPQEKVDEWKAGLTKFMDFIVILAGGLGEALGAFVGGALAGITGLPQVGHSLSGFIGGLLPFIAGIRLIDETVLAGVRSLVEMMALLTGASILEKIGSWITGTSSMETFATQLGQFADAIVAFSGKVKGNINEESVLAAANAGKLLAEMSAAMPKSGGWAQTILGASDMEKFSEGISAFGDAIVSFSQSVSGEGAVNEAAITAAANSGKLLAELQNAVPKTGGWAQEIMGESDMQAFGAGMVAFGYSLVGFSKAVSGDNAVNEKAITAAVNAGTLMTELQKSIPRSGGWAQGIMGEKDLAKFGASIKAFGKAITEFSTDVSVNEEAVTVATNAGMVMATLQKALPEEHWFDGKLSLDDFGKKIVVFGNGIKSFSEEVTGVDTEAIEVSLTAARKIVAIAERLVDLDPSGIGNFKAKQLGEAISGYYKKVEDIEPGLVSSSIASARSLASLISYLADLDASGISNFKVSPIGDAMKSYSESVSKVNSMNVLASITSANRLSTFISSLASIDTSGVSSFKSAVNELSTVNIVGFVKTFAGASSMMLTAGTNMISSLIEGMQSKSESVKTVGVKIVSSLVDGINAKLSSFSQAGTIIVAKFAEAISSKKPSVTSACKSLASEGVKGIRANRSSFETAGEYLGAGLVIGINSKQTAAYNAGYALGQKAAQGEKDGQDSASPSKLTIQAGKWLGDGLIIGMESMYSKVYKSGYKMGDETVSSISSAISQIRDTIDSDMDVQPTIRPVLDLSDVESGAGSINRMLDFGSSVGVLSNVNAISTMMNRRNQNGGNTEIISAIDKLRKDIGNVGGTSYTINGITYDDGSNVSEAVKALVRAARVERRV